MPLRYGRACCHVLQAGRVASPHVLASRVKLPCAVAPSRVDMSVPHFFKNGGRARAQLKEQVLATPFLHWLELSVAQHSALISLIFSKNSDVLQFEAVGTNAKRLRLFCPPEIAGVADAPSVVHQTALGLGILCAEEKHLQVFLPNTVLNSMLGELLLRQKDWQLALVLADMDELAAVPLPPLPCVHLYCCVG